MEVVTGLALLAAFLAVVVLIVRGQSPIIMLLLLALVWAVVINLATALLFPSMYGVGAAIAIGVIALPIMMSQGIPPRVAAPAFTMGIGAGTFINLVQFGTFQKLFPGLTYTAPWLTVWICGTVIYILTAWLMIWWNLRAAGGP